MDTLSRVYSVHPRYDECHCLRLLLFEVIGPTSFPDLKTVEGRICFNYKEACEKRGLLENDAQWDATLKEDIVFKSPSNLRDLFSLLIQWKVISSPEKLWEKYREDFAVDILHKYRTTNKNLNFQYTERIFNEALILIEDRVLFLGGSNIHDYGLPRTNRNNREPNLPQVKLREINYNTVELTAFVNNNVPKLTPDQEIPYFEITNAIKAEKGGLFFIDAPGGTGKTFLLGLLLANERKNRHIALAVASSGIAATLLEGGRTAHSAFKLPLNPETFEQPVTNIKKNSAFANVIKEATLIVWDECTMTHKNNLDILNRTLQDLKNNQELMGGVIFVMAGDFRQTLPIVDRGTRANEVEACIKASKIWKKVKGNFKLTTNMRAYLGNNADDAAAETFSRNLLRLGNGELNEDENGEIDMNIFGNIVQSQQDLITEVYPSIVQQYKFWPTFNLGWLSGRAILAPKNDIVEKINYDLLKQIPTGNGYVYKSIDKVIDFAEAVNYPTEFLHTIDLPGLPPHNLHLKPGVPIMLLRNLEPPKLCNGTRLLVKNLRQNVIEAVILDGKYQNENVFIPRIPITTDKLTFKFKRLQFPVRLSFAMTINKSQGQTLKIAGLDLSSPCFSHGQLYVGCSRVGSPENLYILAPNGKTTNIVYPEALYN